jgi:hypothetical protein
MFQIFGKKYFFQEEKIYTARVFIILLCCFSIYAFIHSHVVLLPPLPGSGLCSPSAPSAIRLLRAATRGGAKQSFASVAELCGVQSAPPGQSLAGALPWHRKAEAYPGW